jgi:putative hydrolase of the HAD superfamily
LPCYGTMRRFLWLVPEYVRNSQICVVFDIDDTLYLERDYVVSGFNAVGRWATDWLAIANFQEHCASAFRSGVRGKIFDEALSRCSIEASPALVQALVEIYRTHVPNIQLTPDCEDTLPQVAERWPIAIVTDGPPAAQSAKAHALSLRKIANPIVLTGTLSDEFGKPHKHGFMLIERALPSTKFVYVADNPNKDFAGPKSLDWITIRVRRGEGLHYLTESVRDRPDVEIPDFTPLLPLLSQL